MSGEKLHELHDRRRARNIAVLLGVLGVAAVMFFVTLMKLQVFAANPMAKTFKPKIGKLQDDTLKAREAEAATSGAAKPDAAKKPATE